MGKEMTEQQLHALVERMHEVFDTVSAEPLTPEEIDAPLSDDGLRVDYELRHGRMGCVLTRRVMAGGRPWQLRMTAPLADEVLPESRMTDRERELCRDEMNHDFLSGVYNRRYLETVLAGDMAAWHSEGRAAAVAFVSLDAYSELVRREGQPAVDELVCFVANQWKKYFWQPREKVVCRLTGSVFVIGCADCTRAALEEQVRTLYAQMPRACVTTSGMMRRMPFTLSIACADLAEAAAHDWKSVYTLADSRLRAVNDAGGDGVFAG